YDPFTQKEYYRLSAYFNSIDESGANDAGGLANPVMALTTPELEQKIAGLKTAEQQAEQELTALDARLRGEQVSWEQSLVKDPAQLAGPTWTPLAIEQVSAEQGTMFTRQEDGVVLAGGPNPATEEY